MRDCEYLAACGFFKKFGRRQSNVWKGLLSFYCQGRGARLCERRKMFLARNTFPGDDLLPTGDEIPKVFLALD